jgi:hypothetical protein
MMEKKSMLAPWGFSRSFAGILLGLMLVWLTACASGPRVVDHAFSFDARVDSPSIEVINFCYGDTNTLPKRWYGHICPKEDGSGVRQGTHINGGFPFGDTLYVKWRIKSSGAMYEDTVDLKSRLPDDITHHLIYFIVSGPQLYVYLIGPERLNPNPCPSREELRRLGASDAPWDKIFSTYCYRRITTIYPDQSQSNKTK